MTVIVTTSDKLTCVERELKYRQRVYARLVNEGKMSQGKATLELAIMQAIIDDYRQAAEKERLI